MHKSKNSSGARFGLGLSRNPTRRPARLRNQRSTIEQVIELRPIDSLLPYERRARTHSDDQIAMIMGSFQAFGFVGAIIVDGRGRILAGHGRWEAAKRLGFSEVPVVQVDHLTEDEIRAYVIADNRLCEKSGWSKEVLALEFQHLASVDLGFELDVIGFSIGEMDFVIGEAGEEESPKTDPLDEIPVAGSESISRPGDLWLLGAHRLLCGNALARQSYEIVMGGDKARMVLTDPPFNVAVAGFVSGLGKNRHREFAMASGEMSEAEFTAFLGEALLRMKESLLDGGLAYVFMDHRHVFELISSARAAELRHVNLCVWDKKSGGMGSFYRSQHELCFVLRNGAAPFLNNIELGKHGRNRTNLWSFPGLASFGRGRDEALAYHPTVKPVGLLAEAIKDCTRRRDIVLDPFCGAGSTLIAAERAGRRGRGIEIDPLYVDTIIARWTKLTGEAVILEAGGKSFPEIARERSALRTGKENLETKGSGLCRASEQESDDRPVTSSARVRHRARKDFGTGEASHV